MTYFIINFTKKKKVEVDSRLKNDHLTALMHCMGYEKIRASELADFFQWDLDYASKILLDLKDAGYIEDVYIF